MCVCVCVRERDVARGGEREKERDRQTEMQADTERNIVGEREIHGLNIIFPTVVKVTVNRLVYAHTRNLSAIQNVWPYLTVLA